MASATPDDTPNQTINAKLCDGTILIGYGKRGHGMNGKDADLDRVGQCLVTELVTEDPVGATQMRVLIRLRLYACICAPSYGGIEFEKLKDYMDADYKAFFLEHYKVDIDKLDPNSESKETERQLSKIVGHFRDQAAEIVCGMDPCPDDPFAFMWNDDSWDGGTDIELEVPLSVDEYDAIEFFHGEDWQSKPNLRGAVREALDKDDFKVARKAIRDLQDFVRAETRAQKALDKVAARISREIWDGNKGGTPARDRMKRFEDEVGLCNDMINRLECYRPKEKASSDD